MQFPLLKSLADDDVFISYSREDGETYLDGLSDALMKLNFSCFDDRQGTEAGRLPPETLFRRIRSCRTLVLLATSSAITSSKYVAQEVRHFADARGTARIVAISFDKDKDELDDWSKAEWFDLVDGKSRARESLESIESGVPSSAILSRIQKKSDYLKSKDRLRRYRNGAFAVFLVLLIVIVAAVGTARTELTRAANATSRADAETARAATAFKAAETAQTALSNAEHEVQVQTESARRFSNEAAEKAKLAADASLKVKAANEDLRKRQIELDQATTHLNNANANLQKAKTDLTTAETKTKEAENGLVVAKAQLATAVEETRKQIKLAEDASREAKRGTIRFYQERGRQSLLNGNSQGALIYLNRAFQMTHANPTVDVRLSSLAFLTSWASKSLTSEIASLNGHENRVTSGSFSPDNKRVITVSDDGTARVWDAANGQLLATLSSGYVNPVMLRAEFSPNGQRIITVNRNFVQSDDRQIPSHEQVLAQLWDAVTYENINNLEEWILQEDVEETADWVEPCFISDGSRFELRLSEDGEDSTKVFNSADGKEIEEAQPTCSKATPVKDVTWQKDNPVIEIKNLSSGKSRIYDTQELHLEHVFVNADRTLFLTTSGNQERARGLDLSNARLWDGTTGKLIAALEGQGAITNVVFSNDGTLFVTTGQDGVAKIWLAKTGSLLSSLSGHQDAVLSAAFSSDNKQLLTTGEDNRAIIWNWGERARVLLATFQNDGPYATFKPDGKQIVAANKSGKLITYDTSWRTVSDIDLPKDESVLALSPNGSRVITKTKDGMNLIDTRTGTRIAAFQKAKDVEFSNDGRYVVTSGVDIEPTGNEIVVGVFDSLTGEQRWGASYAHPVGDANLNSTLAVNPDGSRIFVAVDLTKEMWTSSSNDWNLIYPRESAQHIGKVTLSMFSPDDQYLVTAAEDKTIRIWVQRQRKKGPQFDLVLLHPPLIGHTAAITSLRFSPNNKLLVTTSVDGTAKVWDVATGKLFASCDGHRGAVNAAAFSSDNERLVTGGNDGTIKIWDPITGDLLATIDAHDGPVTSVVYDATDELVVSSGADAAVRVWDLRYSTPDPLKLDQWVMRIASLKISNEQLVPITVKNTQPNH